MPKLLEQDVRVSDDLPFGSRGGIAVRHNFPLDGEYVFKVRLRRQIYDYIVGMGHPQQLDLRIDGTADQAFHGRRRGQGHAGAVDVERRDRRRHAVGALHARRGCRPGGSRARPGRRASGDVSFVDSPWEPEGVTQPLQVDFGRGSDEQYDGYAAVDALSILGPYRAAGAGDTPSRRAVFVCTPKTRAEEAPCAKKIVSTLARRAYRRPVTADEIQTLLDLLRSRPKRSADSKPGSSRRSSGCSSASIFCFGSKAIRRTRHPAPSIASAISILRRACRSFSGAASPTKSC